MSEKISVIIPAYNSSRTIEKAVQSVLAQTYSNIEIIVVDDGSNDNTSDKLEEIMSCHDKHQKPIKFLREGHGGVSSARNLGIQNSNGELIAFLDSDDLLTSDSLKIRQRYLEENPEKMAVFGATRYINRNGRVYSIRKYVPKNSNLPPHAIEFLTARAAPFHPSSLMYRRSVFHTVGLFDTELRRCEDADFVYRLLSQCSVGSVEQVVYDYVVSSHNPIKRLAIRFQDISNKFSVIQKQTTGIRKYWLLITNLLIEPTKYAHQTLFYRD